MLTTNLFVIANVKQLRTEVVFRILLPFFRTSLGVGVLNSAIFFNSFDNRIEFGTILEGLRNFCGGGFEHPPHRYATGCRITNQLPHRVPPLQYIYSYISPFVVDCNRCISFLVNALSDTKFAFKSSELNDRSYILEMPLLF